MKKGRNPAILMEKPVTTSQWFGLLKRGFENGATIRSRRSGTAAQKLSVSKAKGLKPKLESFFRSAVKQRLLNPTALRKISRQTRILRPRTEARMDKREAAILDPSQNLVTPSQPPPSSGSATGLLTSHLIRPHGDLLRAVEGFLLDQRSEHTRRAYAKDLKRFVKFLIAREAERGPEVAGRTVLIAYKDSLLSEGLQHTTIDRHLATLRTFFRWLRDEGLIAVNPAEGVRFLKPRRVSTTEGFTDAEVRKVLSLPNLHSRTGAQHYAILMLLFHCGLRRGELCSLRTSAVTEERGHWILKLKGKGNRERIVVLVPEVYQAVRHHMRMNSKSFMHDDWLYSPIRNNRTKNTGKPLDSSMIFWLVRRYAREAGVVKRVSPHSCRATAISHARDRNVPDRAIQDFAGWASPDMITRYDKRRTSIEKSAAHVIHYGGEPREIPAHEPVSPGFHSRK